MATRLKPVDVVLAGVGWTGSILAKELSEAGLSVVGLERGAMRQTVPDFQSPGMHDELKYAVRHALMQDVSRDTVTVRNSAGQVALPMRQLGSFLPGTDLGGAGVHWNGQTWRFLPTDFKLRSHYTERYGKDFIDPDLSIQDWPLTYDELEPFYDRFERLLGTGGKAGNLKGVRQQGGNPFEGPRAAEYPNPPMKRAYSGALFAKACEQLGHHPFPQPSSNCTRDYTNIYGIEMKPCMYCGFCERFGCEHFAKASPQASVLPKVLGARNFELRTGATVTRVLTDDGGRRATGVLYTDASGREFEQPAELVALCSFAYNNVRLLLLSGIGRPYDPQTGEGVVGRNYAYQTMSSVDVFYDADTRLNPFMGAGALGVSIDDFNGDNFDHGGLKFVGGAYISAFTTGARPIQFHPTPPGTPKWGLAWKQAVARHYNHTATITVEGSSMSRHANYVDLDPTYRDLNGLPLLRITFDFSRNDHAMSAYCTDRAAEIGRAMGGKTVSAKPVDPHWSVVPYQTTHNTGGAIMGDSPANSVVNRYLQSWDVPNLFVMGSSVFPQNPSYNPTNTVGALTYWAVDAIKSKYLKAPGALVPT